MDYAGPFLGHYFFIVVDGKTNRPEVFVEKRAPTSTITIRFLQDVISRHGIPDQLVSDNAAIFKSAEFITFCKSRGIRQRFIAPGHPATNDQLERYGSTIKNKLKKMSVEGSLQENLLQLLFRYRTTPSVSGETPAEKLYGRNLRTKLDLLKPKEKVLKFPHSLGIKHFQVGERVQSRNYNFSKVFSRI
ncbi:Retrotransposon protein [Nesidiocoris tenuis]|uniref:Retrotransposon protein n=1 Tax=Nesidiocoris tenuis TaxID=355587 RepID=A0ABN7AC90_9HEMI|nr:Retrotransposon protein [Nesidiocoris tenuis]